LDACRQIEHRNKNIQKHLAEQFNYIKTREVRQEVQARLMPLNPFDMLQMPISDGEIWT